MSEVPAQDIYFVTGARQPGDDLAMQCEVWVADICAAAWVSKEAMKIAAVISLFAQDFPPKPAYTRDMESRYSLQPEEVQRGLRMLKLFGCVEDFLIDRGRLTVKARLNYAQRLRLKSMRDAFAALKAEDEAEQLASDAAAALRAVAAEAEGPVTEPASETVAAELISAAA